MSFIRAPMKPPLTMQDRYQHYQHGVTSVWAFWIWFWWCLGHCLHHGSVTGTSHVQVCTSIIVIGGHHPSAITEN